MIYLFIYFFKKLSISINLIKRLHPFYIKKNQVFAKIDHSLKAGKMHFNRRKTRREN